MKVLNRGIALVMFTLAMCLMQSVSWAQTTGTNAVDTLVENINYGSGAVFPVMVGLLGVFLMIGLVKKFGRKAGVSA